MTSVAIQGEAGSFSHDAAAARFGARVSILPCPTFAAVFEALAEGRAPRAIVPVENTIVGPIAETVALLESAPVRRAGETRLRVDHCLIVAGRAGGADDGTGYEIRRVASHPMALAQCAGFLRGRPGWTSVETPDTAGAVRALAEGSLAVDAVIASRHAAKRYGCRVLREAIQDEPANVTTFLILESMERAIPLREAGRERRATPALRDRTARDPCWRVDRRR